MNAVVRTMGLMPQLACGTPMTEPSEFSLSQIWVASDGGGETNLNTMEAG